MEPTSDRSKLASTSMPTMAYRPQATAAASFTPGIVWAVAASRRPASPNERLLLSVGTLLLTCAL
ncbi:hypothetical protein SD78_3617 [Bacillus badius]|nr:hypothetical protein SD78_3617 [Bacillus badius]